MSDPGVVPGTSGFPGPLFNGHASQVGRRAQVLDEEWDWVARLYAGRHVHPSFPTTQLVRSFSQPFHHNSTQHTPPPPQALLFGNLGQSGWGGLANRGMGGEGMALVAGGVYEGFVFVNGGPVNAVRFRLVDVTTTPETVLSEQIIVAPPSGDPFVRLNFSLPATSAGTSCVPIPAGSDPTIDCAKTPNADHACVRCGGEFRVEFNVTANGSTTPPFACECTGVCVRRGS